MLYDLIKERVYEGTVYYYIDDRGKAILPTRVFCKKGSSKDEEKWAINEATLRLKCCLTSKREVVKTMEYTSNKKLDEVESWRVLPLMAV